MHECVEGKEPLQFSGFLTTLVCSRGISQLSFVLFFFWGGGGGVRVGGGGGGRGGGG